MDFNNTFIWNELMTADIEGAKAFYGAVAGWTFKDMPMDDGSTYVVANTGNRPDGVAGIMEWPADAPGANDWMPYLGVTKIEDSVAAVRAAGGTVIRDTFMVPGVGKIAMVADRTGTVLGFLEPTPMGSPA